jgi:glutamate-1-semialdehyde aminotransferase
VERIANLRDRVDEDRARATEFSHGLLANGVFAVPRPLFMSAAHTEKDVDAVLEAAAGVLEKIRRVRPAGVGSAPA